MTNTGGSYEEHPDGKALLANIHLAEATTAAAAWGGDWTESELGTGIPQMKRQRREMRKGKYRWCGCIWQRAQCQGWDSFIHRDELSSASKHHH